MTRWWRLLHWFGIHDWEEWEQKKWSYRRCRQCPIRQKWIPDMSGVAGGGGGWLTVYNE